MKTTLYKKIERARKIYRLTEKIGLDKIKHIKSYSANSISKFTNKEIQRVIDHFTKNLNMEFTDGDFCQVLPVILHASRAEVVSSSLSYSSL